MMCTEREKMLRGDLYDPADPELVAARLRARKLWSLLNQSSPDDLNARSSLIKELFGKTGHGVSIEPPFYCDYGTNISLGNGVYLNVNCTILDPAEVIIGDNTLIGPSVQIYTPSHPLDAEERLSMKESAQPIEIGKSVWIGGGAILCPGVKIGDRSIIGAGSVVTRDVPSDVVVAGNPGRIIRSL